MKEAQNESAKWNRFAAVTNREEVAFRKNLKIELILSTESKWPREGGKGCPSCLTIYFVFREGAGFGQ